MLESRNAFSALIIRVGGIVILIAGLIHLLIMIALGSVSSFLTVVLQSISFLSTIFAFASFLTLIGVVAGVLGIGFGYLFLQVSYEVESGITKHRRDVMLLLSAILLALSLLAQSWLSFLGAILVMSGLLLARTQISFHRSRSVWARYG